LRTRTFSDWLKRGKTVNIWTVIWGLTGSAFCLELWYFWTNNRAFKSERFHIRKKLNPSMPSGVKESNSLSQSLSNFYLKSLM
jgi:hypothetical protein